VFLRFLRDEHGRSLVVFSAETRATSTRPCLTWVTQDAWLPFRGPAGEARHEGRQPPARGLTGLSSTGTYSSRTVTDRSHRS
jgi:hypothetical protein